MAEANKRMEKVVYSAHVNGWSRSLICMFGNLCIDRRLEFIGFHAPLTRLAAKVAGRNHLRGQPEFLEQLDLIVGDVDFPPTMLVGGARWIVMVVVVPPFAHGQDRDEPVVPAVIVGLVVRVAEEMGQRVD